MVAWCLGFGHVVSQHIMMGIEVEESVHLKVSGSRELGEGAGSRISPLRIPWSPQ